MRRWTALAGLVAASPVVAQDTTTYTYDALGRVIAANVTGGREDKMATSIQYDSAGNRTNYQVADAHRRVVVVLKPGGKFAVVPVR